MLLLFNSLIIGTTALLILAFIRQVTRSSYLLAFFIVVSAEIIIIFQGLSLITALTHSGVMLAQIAVFFSVAILWAVLGRPTLLSPFRSPEGKFTLWGDGSPFKSDRLLLVVAIILSLGFLILLLICLLTYDEFIDTVLYHYPKIALWKQNQTMFFNGETARFIRDTRIIGSPPVAESLYLWLFFWVGSIKAINVVELLAVLPVMLAIYSIVMQIHGNPKVALLSAFIFPTFELVIWNLEHANAVMLLTAFFLAGIYFMVVAEKDGARHAILLSAGSLALAVATKPSIYTMLPIAGILLAISLVRGTRRHGMRWLRWWLVAGGAALLVITAPIWVQNAVLFHDPLLLSSWGVTEISHNTDPSQCAGLNILRNFHARTAPHIALPAIGDILLAPFNSVILDVGRLLNLDLLSDVCRASSPFTPTSGKPAYSIIYLPLYAGAIAGSWLVRKKNNKWGTLPFWFLLIGYFFLFSGFRPYSEPSYRYFALSAALFAIVLSDMFTLLAKSKNLLAIIFGISLLSGSAYLRMQVIESFKSLDGLVSAIVGEDMREPVDITLQGILEPGTRSLGVFQSYDAIDIAYFGDDLSREIVFSDCVSIYQRLTSERFEYLVYDSTYPNWDFETCLAEYQTPEGNPLRELLADEYIRVYERWNQYRYLLVFRQKESTPLYAEFPPGVPIIFISGEYQRSVGGGPVAYFQRGTGLPDEEFLFSLRALVDIEALPVAITFSGDACAAGQVVNILVYDENYAILYEGAVPLSDGALQFFTDIRPGINRIFINEICEAEMPSPLQIEHVLIGG